MASSLRDKINDAKDDEIVADYSEARDSLPDLEDVPVGTYDATVVECEPGTSAEGNPKVVFKFELAEHQKTEGCWGTIFRHAPTTGGGSGIFRDTVTALGFDPNVPFKCSAAVGADCVIKVGNRKKGDGTEVKQVKAVPAAKAAAKPAAKKAAPRRRVG